MNKIIKLILNPNEPWIYDINGQNCKGIQCQLLLYVSKSMNFSYQFIIDDFQSTPFPNGTWTGFMGRMQQNVHLNLNSI